MDVLLAAGEARRQAAEQRNAEFAEDAEEIARLFGPDIVGDEGG